ncbi:putative helicase [hydrothermal vent metagenome]|uniref:Putative helicase n=1 Tax=hydrothermal vent metagenome TaxID=652676 RepID=A0A1W1C631_9ZZZZ
MKQETALNILKSGKNVFITGSAGTGKTYLLNQYIQYLKERRIYPTIVAPTGISASHLKGQTIHSFFALGIRDTVVDNAYIGKLLEKKYLINRFSKLQLLIIDEVSMVSPEIFDSMDKILRAFKNSSEPFGGVQVVISGDFFQLPPVSKEFKEKRFAWQSPAWKELDLKSCYLQEKFRQDDNRLVQILDEIRLGSVSESSHALLESCFYKKLNSKFNPTKLYTHNVDVDRINLEELNKLKGKPYTFKYSSNGSEKNIEKIFKTALVLEELTLKKGAIVIFIKNNTEKKYVNGTTGVVIGFDGETPIVQTTSGKKIRVLTEDWTIENDKGKTIATVSQIPLRLAWAITIHKSQGMTLDSAQIDLSKTFEVGQGYVALSRLKSIDGLRLMGINEMALRVEPLTLRIDEPIKKASLKATKEIESYSKKELKKSHSNYIKSLGGLLSLVLIEEERKLLRTGK